MRAAFVVSGLLTGGAEMMLYKLLKTLPRGRVEPLVISLGRCGRPAELIKELGVSVIGLKLDGIAFPSVLQAALKGRSVLKEFQPHLVCGWMYHGNLAAWLFTRGLDVPLAWNIRQTLNLAGEKAATRGVIRTGAFLSRTPKRIVYVSRIAREQHRAIGYCADHDCVLPNGFDLDDFRRDAAQRARLRTEFGANEDTCVIGHLARYHPAKDQVGLIDAARRVVAEAQRVLFVFAGAGLDGVNTELATAIRECRLQQHVRLLGETACPQALLSACDLFCLPSAWGEGFPNAVGEAMACELPCVVTRVGEAPDVVGATGAVVEPGDREGLSQALLQLVRLGHSGRAQLGARARDRILERFSLPDVAARYADVFDEAVSAVKPMTA
jgi:glycosyltransferase involved in cell wall biosynthesis